MAELTEVATEAVAEVAEEVAEQATNIAEVSRGLTPRDLSLVLGGVVVGAGVGYLWTRRRLETKYNQFAEEEISAMREHFHKKAVAGEDKPDLDALVGGLGYAPPVVERDQVVPGQEAVVKVKPEVLEDDQPVEGLIKQNVFEQAAEIKDDWDYEMETASRSHDVPYVIHADERRESGYTETTLTYYAGDDVLCDEQDKVINDQDGTVGVANLDRFGHGSGDPEIVYVRNDALAIEVEIVRSDKTYAEEVHGLSHSNPARRRRVTWDE